MRTVTMVKETTDRWRVTESRDGSVEAVYKQTSDQVYRLCTRLKNEGLRAIVNDQRRIIQYGD